MKNFKYDANKLLKLSDKERDGWSFNLSMNENKVYDKNKKKRKMKNSNNIKNYIDKLISRIDERFDHVEKRIDNLEKRIDNLEKRIDNLEKRMDKLEDVLMKFMITTNKNFELINTRLDYIVEANNLKDLKR